MEPIRYLSKVEPLPQHSSKTDLWYTPISIVERARVALGGYIYLDPASDAFGNSRIKADLYYTEENDGLKQEWSSRIFLNPPGGKIGNKSRMKLFWQKLMATRAEGKLSEAVFLAFSLEALATTQGPGEPSLCDFVVCVPRARIKFDGPDGISQKQPTHANAIVYVPGVVDFHQKFVQEFSSLGACLYGPRLDTRSYGPTYR